MQKRKICRTIDQKLFYNLSLMRFYAIVECKYVDNAFGFTYELP